MCPINHQTRNELGSRAKLARRFLEGHTVELKSVSNIDGVTSADFWVDGVLVEVKAPKGSSKNTVYDLIRKGSRQSPIVIIGLHRCPLSVDEVESQTLDALRRYGRLEVVFAIEKSKNIRRWKRG